MSFLNSLLVMFSFKNAKIMKVRCKYGGILSSSFLLVLSLSFEDLWNYANH
jgi:hypothetical protein